MVLEDEAIEAFRRLYLQRYGVELTREEAIEYGSRLVSLVKAVYGKHIPKIEIDNTTRKKDNADRLN
jgi:hypothetical protein